MTFENHFSGNNLEYKCMDCKSNHNSQNKIEKIFKKEKTLNKKYSKIPFLDAYIKRLHAEIDSFKESSLNEKELFNIYRKSANTFFKNNLGLDYEKFLSLAKPEEIEGKGYSGLSNGEKRDFFDKKASIHFSALSDTEKKGYNTKNILKDFREEMMDIFPEGYRAFVEINLMIRLEKILRDYVYRKINVLSVYNEAKKIKEEFHDALSGYPETYDQKRTLVSVLLALDQLHDSETRRSFRKKESNELIKSLGI